MRAALPQVEGPFVFYSEEFRAVLGDDPRLEELVETDAHEGTVYVAALDALFFTTVPPASFPWHFGDALSQSSFQ